MLNITSRLHKHASAAFRLRCDEYKDVAYAAVCSKHSCFRCLYPEREVLRCDVPVQAITFPLDWMRGDARRLHRAEL